MEVSLHFENVMFRARGSQWHFSLSLHFWLSVLIGCTSSLVTRNSWKWISSSTDTTQHLIWTSDVTATNQQVMSQIRRNIWCRRQDTTSTLHIEEILLQPKTHWPWPSRKLYNLNEFYIQNQSIHKMYKLYWRLTAILHGKDITL